MSRLDDDGKRRVVARLRRRYDEALEFLCRPERETQSFENLEWILGARRDKERDTAGFTTSLSELVVLWLDDLAAELECRTPGIRAAESPATSASRTPDSRSSAAESLRVATSDFAAAFLSPPACVPARA